MEWERVDGSVSPRVSLLELRDGSCGARPRGNAVRRGVSGRSRLASRAWTVLLGCAAVVLVSCGGARPSTTDGAYAGSGTCAGCHAVEGAAWSPSLHAAALRSVSQGGLHARFDGVLRTFPSLTIRPVAASTLEIPADGDRVQPLPLTFVLGRAQIEQFLTPTTGGRLQALPIGYDTVADEWFDIYPEAPSPSEWTHWTNGGMNANSRCLFCHTTAYTKGYLAATDTFDTRWGEAGVGCEACHGPGRAHAERHRRGESERAGAYGAVAPDACAPCHVRAVPLTAAFTPGVSLLDAFSPELLDSAVYHADGSLADEAFEWTSFQMSLMAARGVVCTDCHEPHGASLRASGDKLCLRCHRGALADETHTHHPAASDGARCVGCHMPPVVFMERDVRRDHRIARPDPEGAAALGAPDACTRCHAGESSSWAAARLRDWYGEAVGDTGQRRVNSALRDAKLGDETSIPGLLTLLESDADAVRRASAARLLRPWVARPRVTDALRAATGDPASLVRAGAASALAETPAATRPVRDALVHLMTDPVLLVRIEAAFGLRAIEPGDLPPEARAGVERASAEWLASQDAIAENPDAEYNSALFLAARGDVAAAEMRDRTAIRLWPGALPARDHLAHLLAASGRDADAEHEWQELLARAPGWPPAAFSLALLAGRQGHWPEAIAQLEACLATDPSYARAQYNLAVAYERSGDRARARAAYEAATHDPAARSDALRDLARLTTEDGDATDR